MKNVGTKKPKMKKDPNNIKGRGAPPNMAVSWGRGASEYRPGIFVKKSLEQHRETCAADIYRAMSEEIERINKERIEIGEKPFRRPNYSSFSRYFHWFLILGLIERTGKLQASAYPFLEKRVFYRLTDKGKAEKEAWQDPIRAAHPEFG